LLVAAGLAAAFNSANHALGRNGKPPFYAVETISPHGGLVASSSGVALETRALADVPTTKVDTLLIVGAEAEHILAAVPEPLLHRWVPHARGKQSDSDRYVPACSFSPLSAF
jgi:hypothetical protein